MNATGIWVTILIVLFLLVILYQSVAAIGLLASSIADRVRTKRKYGAKPISLENRVLFTFVVSIVVISVVANRTLAGVNDLLRVYVGIAAMTWFWSSVRSYSSGTNAYHGIITGFFAIGPAAVALLLLINLIPLSIVTEEHILKTTGMKCTGISPRGCIPIMNFVDGAFEEWDRARTRHDLPADGTRSVRFTIGNGLIGFPVIFSRTDLAADGSELH